MLNGVENETAVYPQKAWSLLNYCNGPNYCIIIFIAVRYVNFMQPFTWAETRLAQLVGKVKIDLLAHDSHMKTLYTQARHRSAFRVFRNRGTEKGVLSSTNLTT